MEPLIDHSTRMARTRACLEGLSVGDAFGERFFRAPEIALAMIEQRALPAAPWTWTDDTAMAISVVETLSGHCGIDRDDLARRFAARYIADRARGYGGGAHRLLGEISLGESWRDRAPALFDGGSYGNGGAMRVAPVGAYFSDDLALAAHHGGWSAEPTHAHAEGRAGAIAIAVAAAFAQATREVAWSADEFFASVLEHVPPSEVADGIGKASRVSATTSVRTAAQRLGNGSRISAQDTVPFTLWCMSRHPDDYEAALWTTVAGLGDRDTTCAIVGGIAACRVGAEAIPMLWRQSRERVDLDAC